MRYLSIPVAVAVTAISLAASAADAPPTTLKALMGRGLKVVAVSVVPAEVSKTANASFVVTLQIDKTLAVCTFSVAAWENLTPQMEDDAKACDVRSY